MTTQLNYEISEEELEQLPEVPQEHIDEADEERAYFEWVRGARDYEERFIEGFE